MRRRHRPMERSSQNALRLSRMGSGFRPGRTGAGEAVLRRAHRPVCVHCRIARASHGAQHAGGAHALRPPTPALDADYKRFPPRADGPAPRFHQEALPVDPFLGRVAEARILPMASFSSVGTNFTPDVGKPAEPPLSRAARDRRAVDVGTVMLARLHLAVALALRR